MMKRVPTPIPYQGSKRQLATEILAWAPKTIAGAIVEPFAGSAAISLAAAADHRAEKFLLSDLLAPLAAIWTLILNDPERIIEGYEALWISQLSNPRERYDEIRSEFNQDQDPVKLLYLLARCVKNAVRFNSQGLFNQSPDNRRLGMRPQKMKAEVLEAHRLLVGKTKVLSADYCEVLRTVSSDDLVYMDPPYQGVARNKSTRYIQPLNVEAFISELEQLNERNISYMVSFDGVCGDKTYGDALPAHLNLQQIMLHAGRSSQATLLGRDDVTFESLYLSPALIARLNGKFPKVKKRATLEDREQVALFG